MGTTVEAVFNIDIETCDKCGGDVRIIASVEDPAVLRIILAHLDNKWVVAADSKPGQLLIKSVSR